MTVLNLTGELEGLIREIVLSTPELTHIDPDQVLVCISTGRTGGGGSYAKIHPLRYPGGELSMITRRGRRNYVCTMPSIKHLGREMLYVIYFMVPRFLTLPLREKLVTVFHELYHISPSFDGDIRRFPGKNYAHGSSTKRYNAYMKTLVDSYLERLPDRTHLSFLEGNLEELRRRHAGIVARRLKAPRITVTLAR